MPALLRYTGAVERDPAITRWLDNQSSVLRPISETWYRCIRGCGPDVRELMHDGCATVCVEDAPFAYVAAFTSHVNVGFFQGAALPDPASLLVGAGKRMRHVKIKPGGSVDQAALQALITAAYQDILTRLRASD